jgi:hypothetical protein
MNNKPLTAAMDNVLASKLGKVAKAAGDPDRTDVGDSIDRGLILRRMLEEAGFGLIELPHPDPKQEEIRQRLKAW